MKKNSVQNIHIIITRIFANALSAKPGSINGSTAYNSHPQWDSLKHLEIISNLEQAFKINLNMEDIAEMTTIKKAEEIIARHIS